MAVVCLLVAGGLLIFTLLAAHFGDAD